MKTVLFACVHNAGRSQMAAAWFNRLADPAKARAVSAGTNPGTRVHPEVVEAMREEGIDLAGASTTKLTGALAGEAHMLVTMGCGDECPYVPGALRDDWPLPDPKNRPLPEVRAIRDEIRERVWTLIEGEGWTKTPGVAVGSLRLATADDAPAVAAIYRPVVETTSISFETETLDDEEMRRRILETLETHPWLVHVHEGEVAGFAYASRHRTLSAYQWSVDTSVYVADGFQRHGIGRQLYRALFAILAAQGFVNAYAGIALPNPASVAFHERMGFAPIGIYRNVGYKLGSWHDVGWWQRPLKDTPVEPGPLESLHSLTHRTNWTKLLGGTP